MIFLDIKINSDNSYYELYYISSRNPLVGVLPLSWMQFAKPYYANDLINFVGGWRWWGLLPFLGWNWGRFYIPILCRQCGCLWGSHLHHVLEGFVLFKAPYIPLSVVILIWTKTCWTFISVLLDFRSSKNSLCFNWKWIWCHVSQYTLIYWV